MPKPDPKPTGWVEAVNQSIDTVTSFFKNEMNAPITDRSNAQLFEENLLEDEIPLPHIQSKKAPVISVIEHDKALHETEYPSESEEVDVSETDGSVMFPSKKL